MNDLSLLKKISVILLATFSGLLIFSLIVTLTLQNTVLNKDFATKLALDKASYEIILNQANQAFIPEKDSAKTDPQVDYEAVVKDYITYDRYKNVAQEIVGSFYSYMLGEADSIEFNIKLIESKSEFKNLLKDTLALKLESLEPCQSIEQNLRAAENPFEADCKPQQLSQRDINTFIDEMDSKELNELYASATLSSDDIDLTQSEDDLSNIRNAVLMVPNIILGLVVAILVLIAGTLLIFNTNRSRLAYVGKLLVSSSFTLAVIGIAILLLNSPQATAENIGQNTEGISPEQLVSLVEIARNQLLMSLYLFALTPFIVGVILWILSHHVKDARE